MTARARTDWAGLLRLGLRLGLDPERFWRLSLREWRMLTAGEAGDAPLSRADLERMMEDWPDGR